MCFEKWSSVIGYEGFYSVSNTGRIKNKHERILKPIKSKRGYLHIGLHKKNHFVFRRIHRLVAEAFIPNYENKPQINHLDGNKENNYTYNLEWCTNDENMQHRVKYLPKRNKYKIGYSTNGQEKMVLHLETGIYYTSVAECARHLCIKRDTLRYQLRNSLSNKRMVVYV